MAVACLIKNNMNATTGHVQNQLTRSLERIFEDALSGELKLSGRKLKDFPKTAGKYNLSDTVIADLSRNRFCELPEDITSLAFLERLLVYHNAIRTIPDTIRGLHSLTYLDLRNNQLSVLPRELCFLPLQVLLVSNNRLVSLPEELGRMESLTELDGSCNQIVHLPARMSDLKNLRSLSLRNNQLAYLPRDLTCLQLVFLDVSCNRISTLPNELRLMKSLVDLELSNNPLTSPPASLCVRGMVHVFKYLETVANKEEKSKSGGIYDGHTTLRRTTIPPRHGNSFPETNSLKANRRQNVDSGYSSTSERWSSEMPQPHAAPINNVHQDMTSKWSPQPLHIRTDSHLKLGSGTSTPSTLSPGGGGHNSIDGHTIEDDYKKSVSIHDKYEFKKNGNNGHSVNNNNSTDISPEAVGGGDITPDSQKSDEKSRSLGSVQTYKEYKEALRQQRNHESIYRPKDQNTPPDDSPSSNFSASIKSQSSSTSSPVYSSSNQNSPQSPLNSYKYQNGNGHHQDLNLKIYDESNSVTNGKRPVQKVIPSRSVANGNIGSPTATNGNGTTNGKIEYAYVKPNSPLKGASPGILTHNNVPTSGLKMPQQNGASGVPKINNLVNNNNSTLMKNGQKSNKTVSWNRDVPAEKLSFTMRREFDKQKEETELIKQLRTIIETRLKMTLPDDLAPALTDGVVLCHLANHVRPRSVGSIHVPSQAVPKLTMARCRRNVDNFLEACRRIGVDEELICSCYDIVPEQDEPPAYQEQHQDDRHKQQSDAPPNLYAMLATIEAFLNKSQELLDEQHKAAIMINNVNNATPATTTNNNNNSSNNNVTLDIALNENENESDYDNYFKKCGIHFQKKVIIPTDDIPTNDKVIVRPSNIAPKTLDLTQLNRKRKYTNSKIINYQGNETGTNTQLNEIIEECEYDSDIGKFNCNNFDNMNLDSENSSFTSSSTANNEDHHQELINDLDTPNKVSSQLKWNGNMNDLNINKNENDNIKDKIVMKRIEFFENNNSFSSNNNNVVVGVVAVDDHKCINENENILLAENEKIVNKKTDVNQLSTVLCLLTFVFSILVFIIFPLPN